MDRAGGRHGWQVNGSFALMWENTPYIPVGMVVTPRSLAEPDAAEAWEQDAASLRALKSAGVLDVLVQPGRPAADVPTAAWQRLVDLLDAEGFRYGIALPIAAPAPVTGYYVCAGSFRAGPLEGGGEHVLEVRIPGLGGGRIERVAASVLDPRTGRLFSIEWPRVTPTSEGAQVSLKLQDPPEAPYVVEMTPLVSGLPGLPDVWSAFDDIRDSLLVLSQVKFGSGLRFFVHPFSGLFDLEGAAGYLVPACAPYRVGFEAFLARKYRRVETLRSQWAVRAGSIDSLEAAARLIPLAITTVRRPPIGYLLDETTGRACAIEPWASRLWHDHLYYREHSVREYANQLAQVLMDQVANVPVVMQRGGTLRYFHINDRQVGGMGGVGIRANAATLHHEAGYAIGEARLAASRPWCIALSLEGYETKDALADAFEQLRRAGVKGGFVTAGPRAPADLPAWVALCRSALERQPGVAEHVPAYVLFPHSVRESGGFAWQHPPIDVEPRELAGGVWWVPTLAGWDPVDLGPDLRGYGIATPAGYEVHLWAPTGKQRIRLCVPAYGSVEARTPSGKVAGKPKKRLLRLDLSADPVILRGMRAEQVVPVELAQADLAEFERLVKEAGLKGHSVRQYQNTLSLARTLDPERDPRGVRQLLREALVAIRKLASEEPSGPRTPQPEPSKEQSE